MRDGIEPDSQVVLGGSARPKARFKELCNLAGISLKSNLESSEESPWLLEDLRKTCATYYDQHVPESAIEILGHSIGGITYRHYAHRSPLAFKAIMTLPQPTVFTSLSKGFEGNRRRCGPQSRRIVWVGGAGHPVPRPVARTPSRKAPTAQ